MAAINSIGGNFINPGNVADQFVFVSQADVDAGKKLIGIGTANRYDGAFGDQLQIDEVVEFVKSGDTASGVTVTDLGSAYQVEFAGDAGTIDTVTFSDDLFLA